jgi:sphingolipid delta-4 desaturase
MAPASPKGGPTDYVAAPVNTVHFEVTTPQPHYARRKALEAAHPELKELAEKRPDTILYVLFAVAAQVGIAWYLRSISASWYVVIGAAFAVGAVMDHLLWVLIHDLTHDSSFDNPIWNKMAACFANIPIIFPAAISFRYYHRLHHSQLNIAWTDPDMPGPTEIGIFGSSFLGKATWMLFFAAIQALRTLRYNFEFGGNEPWIAFNWVTQMSANIAVLWYLGPQGFGYMLASSMFAVGLHPLGARWIAEHYSVHAPQETYSYYGSFNNVSLNVGYHNEHHDLPHIPWQNLPKIRKIAPEFYDTLWYHTSYWALLWAFLSDSRFSLATRVLRRKTPKVYLKRDREPNDEGEPEEVADALKGKTVEAEPEEPAGPPPSNSRRRRKSVSA